MEQMGIIVAIWGLMDKVDTESRPQIMGKGYFLCLTIEKKIYKE